VLDDFATYADELALVPGSAPTGTLHWQNGFCQGLDGVAIYGFIRQHRPATYLEVGSGYSTMFAARARDDGRLPTKIISIDPHPRADVDRLCDAVIRQPLETVDLQPFWDLKPDDIVFVDSSHRVFMNSDAVAFFLDVLPELTSGVVVGIDDILLPIDYFPHWSVRYYSEQYLLAAYLLAGASWLRPLLPCNYVREKPSLLSHLDRLWTRPAMRTVDPRGTSSWFLIER
jgi:hypothetical protein